MSKEQFPVDAYMPLFVGDWLTGEATVAMDPYQKGVFIDLLSWAWKHRGSLPDNVAVLAKFGGVASAWFETPEGRFVLGQFPVCDDGRRRNPKQWAVYQDAVQRREGAHRRAVDAANKRWNRDKNGGGNDPAPAEPEQSAGNAGSNADALPEVCPSLSPSPITTNSSISAALERWPTVVAWATTTERRDLLTQVAEAVAGRHGGKAFALTFLPIVNFALQDGRKPEAVENGLRDWAGTDEGLSANRLRVFLAGATRNARTVAEIESSKSKSTGRPAAENRPARPSKFI